jgi:hypothetical protein
MASHSIPQPDTDAQERPLTYDEGWELFESMRGILKDDYAKLGGAAEFHRKEREAWNEGA